MFKGANFEPLPWSTDQLLDSHPRPTVLLCQNEISTKDTAAIMSAAYERNIQVVFNPSPLPVEPDTSLIPWSSINWLVVNEQELRGVALRLATRESILYGVALGFETGTAPPADRVAIINRASIFMKILLDSAMLAPNAKIVCTLGEVGVLVRVAGDPEEIYEPALQLEGDIRDTTGAGDCFTGYLVSGLMSAEQPVSKSSIRTILRRCVTVSKATESVKLQETDRN